MATEVTCIFNRNSKCIFKGGLCDQDCDRADWEKSPQSKENLLEECLERENRKLAIPKKAVSLLLQFS